jgi:outer membrane protein
VLSRFTPRLSYTFVKRASSIALYEFTQNRLEVGITTAF